MKFAAIELVPNTASDVPETLLGHLNADGTVTGGIPIPGLASWLSDPSTGTATVVQGLNTVPAADEPTIAAGEHRASGVGRDGRRSARCCSCSRSGTASSWLFRRDMPKSRWFLRIAASAGVLAVITMEAGWVVTEVGRQPWIVYNLHEGRGRRHGQHRRVAHVPRRGRALCRARGHDRSSCLRGDEPTVPTRTTDLDEPTCRTGRRTQPAPQTEAVGP